MAEQSLKDKTVKGVGWSAAETFLSHGVSFIVGLVLARLLTPDEYGLIGIVTIFTTVLIGIVDSGFSQSLIRKVDASDEDFNTLFVFNLCVSVVLFAVLFLLAPWIAGFFERPQLIPLVRVMGLLIIIQALSIVQNTILTRRIDFKTKTKASVISAAISGVIGIGFAFAGFGVWSLVAQQLSQHLFYSVCLWFFNKWRPTFSFSLSSLRYMWGFGWKLLVSGLLDNVWKELNQAVVGKFYSPGTLGQYTRAKDYARLFSSNITTVVQRVTYPVLSQVQEDTTRMINAYRRVIKTTMFITSVCMISLGAIAEPLIYCLIGPQWHTAATYLPLICISMSFYPLHAINLNMLKVQGRTDIFLFIEIIKKVLGLAPLFIGAFVSVYAMLVATIIVGFISFFLNSYYTGKKLGYSSWTQLKDIAPNYGIAMIVALSVYFFKYLPISYWIVLPIQLLVGTIVLFLLCEKIKLPEYLEVKEIVINVFRKVTSKNN